ncbi:alkaline phosphatase family protein [Desulfosporosinus lacus]|uniref:Type I phosphodiesterase / nucleotide pyrophosphatase n=1 Tax=Desulfosporosinus lacus DSM 15449 TaxID=1121420 RepID=A0A1M5UIK2_9FIRM|nr:alkaline phosphatase family protein [Desulfosporosinus lacus]SHH62751.1 Type I phosphodiesterase / nucleotide pyrophosphatase [Desulfosporosinus lacus DSM 15449]
MKKVILFVVDSLHPSVLGRILSEGNAPAFRFLVKHGTCIDRVISSFPTMTPVATSSMITGTWPNQHGVPGFIWYDEEIRKIVDYGATWQSILKIGLEKVLRNLLLSLNEDHLNTKTPTLYEELEAGGYSTGNINFFMHRARHTYLTKVPFSLALGTGFRLNREDVSGPSHLTLGQLIHPPFSGRAGAYPRGPFHRFGFNDTFSGTIAAQLVRERQQPDFMVVYFPDNDKYSHQHGPLRSGFSIEYADQQVASVLDEFGTWEKALEENVIIVTGDHAQSTVGLGKEYLIDLDSALKSFKRLKATEEASGEDNRHEIAICPNERMAFIYILQKKDDLLPEVVGILAKDPRNAQISWKVSENKFCVVQGGTEKQLSFSRRGPFRDVYGQTWSYEGDISVVDARVLSEQIIFGKFPDAFNRLISALEARGGSRIAVSAVLGYEYFAVGAPIHPGGGSHGSLEEEDSTVPMIVAGMPVEFDHARIIDLYPMILNHFGLGSKI